MQIFFRCGGIINAKLKKLVHNKAEINATGGGRFKQLPLSPLEEATANLMEFETLLNPGGEIQGIPTIIEIENISTMNHSILEESGTPILNEDAHLLIQFVWR